jgi:hypothetical protein
VRGSITELRLEVGGGYPQGRSGRKTPTRSPVPCKYRSDVKSSGKGSKERVRKRAWFSQRRDATGGGWIVPDKIVEMTIGKLPYRFPGSLVHNDECALQEAHEAAKTSSLEAWDAHLTVALWAAHGIDLVDFPNQPGPVLLTTPYL